VATLKAIYDHETGDAPILIRTHEELSALVDRVSAFSSAHPSPSIVEIYVADDPYGFPNLYAGIGVESGFVHEYWDPPRSTVGDQNAPRNVLYDLQGNGIRTEPPAARRFPGAAAPACARRP
jgi:hypothetical protein